jgi:hypothetical protein
MNSFRYAGFAVVLAVFLGVAFASSTPAAPAANQTEALLPQRFAGWEMQGSAQTSTNPAAADPANAAILKEYRFSDFASATYKQDDGSTLNIRAARFADASGAFGAYTFYLQREMARELIGDQAASVLSKAGQRVLFYRGHVLVDALFSQESVMSAAQLRELAGALPQVHGNASVLPPLLNFIPSQGYIKNTQKYLEGPATLAALGVPVSVDVVDFDSSAEVTTGRYNTPSGEATLILIYYTNSQVAMDHLRRLDPAHQAGQGQAGISTIGNVGPLFYRRTGPIIAIATGPISESDTKSLLEMVNYKASLTRNEATTSPEVHQLYFLILNIVILCGVVGGLAIVAGVAFGGFRILMKRWYPDKVFDRPEHMEFISLHLTETVVRGTAATGPDRGLEPPQKSA